MVPFQHQLLILIGLYLEKSEHQTKTTFKVLIKLKHCQINFLKTLFNIDKWVTKYCYKKSVKHTPQHFCRNKVAAKQSNYQHKQINWINFRMKMRCDCSKAKLFCHIQAVPVSVLYSNYTADVALWRDLCRQRLWRSRSQWRQGPRVTRNFTSQLCGVVTRTRQW